MDDDEPKPEKRYPLSPAKMSKTPSWIMLGFLLGAVFVAALPPLRKKPSREPVTFRAADVAPSAAARPPPQLTTIEAVFAMWGRYAEWTDDISEVALWNAQDKAFTDFYEVHRWGGTFYFRTIPQLTRRIVTRGKPDAECPLQFTEGDESRRDAVNFGRPERAELNLRPAGSRHTESTRSAPRGEPAVKATPPEFERFVPPTLPSDGGEKKE